MESLEARQTMAGTLLSLDIVLVLVLGWYLILVIREDGWRAVFYRIENQAALGLFVLSVGHILIRGWTSVLLWRHAHGLVSWILENTYPVAFVGLGISIIGKACLIRVFTRRWGEWGWIASMLLAGAVVMFTLST